MHGRSGAPSEGAVAAPLRSAIASRCSAAAGAAAENVQPGADDGDLWMPLERRGVEEGQPALDHARASGVDLAQGEGGHDPRGVADVAAGDGVPKCRVGLVVGLQPRGGAAVERRRRLRLVTLGLPPQQVV